VSEFATRGADYGAVEAEPPELAGRNLTVGAQLWASATAFFFIGFVFAYFYLRSLDNGGLWRPKHVDPATGLGTASIAALVAAAIAVRIALAQQHSGDRAGWRRLAALGLALLIAAVGLQVGAWASQDFGPTQGAYASVYIGWTAVLFVFMLGSSYWLETVLATAIRYRRVPVGGEPPAGHASGDPHRSAHDISDPLSLLRPQLTAVSFYLQFLAVVGAITWIILYLI
jgi:heme/copper-type cytochrome/quinol oxidase subunit 3